MGEIVVKLPRLHPAQQTIVGEGLHKPPRYRVVLCGRRFGKTTLALSELPRQALLTGLNYAYFAPTYKYLAPVWEDLCRVLAPVTQRKSETQRLLRLINGGSIECWSLDNEDAGRSRGYAGVVIDEPALVKNLERAWTAIRPTLTKDRGWVLMTGTPFGRGFFYDLYLRATRDENWRCYHYPTAANPYIDPEEIAEAREMLPDRLFRQEYMAEWLDDAGGVFRNVNKACVLEPRGFADAPHARYVLGVDFARKQDFTVICVLNADTREQVYLERFNQLMWDVQVQRVMGVAAQYNAEVIVFDATGVGDAVGEMLAAHVTSARIVPIIFTANKKGEILENLAVAIERGELKLLNDPAQRNELQAYQMDKLPSGRYRYSAPSGMHDDYVSALALAWHGVYSLRQHDWIVLEW